MAIKLTLDRDGNITRQIVGVDLNPTPGFVVRVGPSKIIDVLPSPQLPQTAIVRVNAPADKKDD